MNDTPEDIIVASILGAISEQRLPAGAKLGEQPLSDLFACNRANVRRALASLAAQHVVELRPNRGAFVMTPTPKEARDVFQARRAVERTIARRAVENASAQDINFLRQNIKAEASAKQATDKPTELRLSREFHMHIAKIAANQVLERFLSELTMRSTLILGLYADAGTSCCAEDEHDKIVDAIEAGNAARLVQLTDEHLKHLEIGLNFQSPKNPSSSLKEQLLRSTKSST